MNILQKLNVKARLMVCFVIIALMVFIVGIVGTISVRKVNSNSKVIFDKNLQSVYLSVSIEKNLTEIRANIMKLIYQKNQLQSASNDMNKSINSTNEAMKKYDNLDLNSSEKKIGMNLKTK